ncbi:hypothetical protein LZ24_02489 [Desulfobotulus alkaliphilus]|uniref:Uncharacterized protein n=1 Tax=Desulfobotulus alkaliphilus TaxID=622671 RepID=A0A562RHE7_9BACT|nr:hypothetical protein [Desulfobotulus alkaliphilus]TWI68517.1 hypothetical protein LZ24_02489 [Desulfobotulus alkaliphilus]
MIELTQREVIALDLFLAENWTKFEKAVSDFLSPEEIDSLLLKLPLTTEES